MATPYVLDLAQVDATQVPTVGGKAASLGELMRVDGVDVPPGFCVTTNAFRAAAGGLPDDLVEAIVSALDRFGPDATYAVRSSATVEDLPSASFAGQHDTFLGVAGVDAVLRSIEACWASLSGERAVAYRSSHGMSDDDVAMAVIVQRMVAADAAGVAFTADPLTGHRSIVRVEAVAGLGDALVSGLVTPDISTVRDGEATTIAAGATAVLTDAQVRELVAIARRIEAHFGRPQDIEWCVADGRFRIVQSRPITTLFPLPVAADGRPHLYVSVGHQQMMTDPMTALGLSMFQMTALRPMLDAGGRLFVDVADLMAAPASRAAMLGALGRSDPLIRDALETVLDRGFIPLQPGATVPTPPGLGAPAPIENDPAIVTSLIERTDTSLATLAREIGGRTGVDLFEFIAADVQEMRRLLTEPASMQVIMAGNEANGWLNERMADWLGETNAADVLTQSVPHNVTAEMGFALLDVADVIRPFPAVVARLRRASGSGFLDDLDHVQGGAEARAAIRRYLDRYGMRCVGEIDITRPRWSEQPSLLLPVLLGNVDHFEEGEARRRFERGARLAAAKEHDLLARLRRLPEGEAKAAETKRMIDRVRMFAGFREYPKYGIVCRYFLYKQALMAEADRLVHAGAIGEREDVFHLTFDEFREAVRAQAVDQALVRRRAAEFRSFERLAPPRVLTSDGEALSGAYRRDDVPAGALAGLAVSAGTVEGRARVILDMAAADLAPGDVLVTPHTDPSWTPLFLTAAALVTEVGGLMTHGAVIAREYGLPAVVGVQRATALIHDGDRIRVNGTDGYVEVLSAAPIIRP